MIKYETIISNFDDKVTLYNWLRKVEEALKNASATNFVVNKKGNATLSFSITFADGTTLESGDIVLQQGESVDGARIASGVLQLHLTNGTWLTAGNLGAVSSFSINASQHLIVTYQDGTTQDLGAIFNGNVTISGNLSVTGTMNAAKVMGDEIIENMDGYNFTKIADKDWDCVYAGICKNGNKLTFAVFGKLTSLSTDWSSYSIGYFVIPRAIGEKLFPYSLGAITNILDDKEVSFFSGVSDYHNVPYNIRKDSDTSITIILRNLNGSGLVNDTEYVFRIEETFLLSENLAS